MRGKAVRLTVDFDVCAGHGLCYFESSQLFDLRDSDGKAVVLVDEVPDHLVAVARTCVDGCPERAITVEE